MVPKSFFKYYSMMAEGPLYVLALLPLFWKKYGITAFFALSEVLGGTILQILKHTFCFERPVSLFEQYQGVTLPLVQGVDMHHGNSFPSGHASTFFVFFTCCAIIFAYYYMRRLQQNGHADHMKWFLINTVMLSMLVMAALGAYSRIYLSQHFLSDVCMGCIIGFATPCLVFCFCRKWLLKLNF